jgi:hypothetical protein
VLPFSVERSAKISADFKSAKFFFKKSGKYLPATLKRKAPQRLQGFFHIAISFGYS